jgi:hypothetical protein
MTVLFLALLSLALATLALHVWLDIRRRKGRFEGMGIETSWQLLHPAHPFVNVLPRRILGVRIFPYRFPSVGEEITARLLANPSKIIALVAYGHQQIFTNDLDLAHDIGRLPKPNAFYESFGIYGPNIFSVTDPAEHRKMRALVKKPFCRANYQLVVETVSRHMRRMMEAWAVDPLVDIDRDAVRLMLAVLGESVMGADLAASDRPGDGHRMSLLQALHNVCKYLPHKAILPKLLLRLPMQPFSTVTQSFDEFGRYLSELCKRGLARGGGRCDILSLLLGGTDTQHLAFPNVFIFLAAGKGRGMARWWWRTGKLRTVIARPFCFRFLFFFFLSFNQHL